jgi:hypothetical protein
MCHGFLEGLVVAAHNDGREIWCRRHNGQSRRDREGVWSQRCGSAPAGGEEYGGSPAWGTLVVRRKIATSENGQRRNLRGASGGSPSMARYRPMRCLSKRGRDRRRGPRGAREDAPPGPPVEVGDDHGERAGARRTVDAAAETRRRLRPATIAILTSIRSRHPRATSQPTFDRWNRLFT